MRLRMTGERMNLRNVLQQVVADILATPAPVRERIKQIIQADVPGC